MTLKIRSGHLIEALEASVHLLNKLTNRSIPFAQRTYMSRSHWSNRLLSTSVSRDKYELTEEWAWTSEGIEHKRDCK